ncbi:hypothetical protein PC41400_17065 [Paenibacillus chitinolyticus]|uniref:Uncharacterized protein n=1 Tax=Paenibacillus chitinolyticus TaxID=79263 RepID=A0A410WY75_9BACL|nr:hypothetical protein PC41400_17065 [Paenibacillus chitinolyticus]
MGIVRRNRWIIIISIVVLSICIGYIQFQRIVQDSQIKSWSSNWGFEAPPPEKVTTVFHNGGRDPDYYLISDYNEVAIEKLIQQNDWRKIENSDGIVSDHINVYKKQIQNLHQEYERYEKLFLDNPVKFNHDSLYFTEKKADGSYIIAVLNIAERRLYTMEVFY